MQFSLSKRSWLGSRYGVLLFAFVVAVAFVGVWSYQLWQGKERAILTSETAAENLARASEDANNRTIQAVDLILTSVAAGMKPGGWANGQKGRAFLSSLLDEAPQVREVAFADTLGMVTNISRRGVIPDLSVAHEAYFQQALSGTMPSLLISKPYAGRLLGDNQAAEPNTDFWHLIAARSVYDDIGGFLGVAIAVINPGFLQEQINALDVGRRGHIAYYRYDGELLVRGGNISRFIDSTSHANHPLFKTYLPQREWGTFRQADDYVMGAESIVSYRATTRWPFVVAVVLNVDETLAPWLREATDFSIVMAGGLAVLLLLAFIVYRQRATAEQAEEQLTLLGTALETSANMALITDFDSRIVWVNDAFCKQFGYEFHEVVGKNPNILKSGLVSAEAIAEMWELTLSGRTWNGEMINQRKDGSLVIVNQTISPIMNADGEITHFVAIHDDITERKRSEERLLEAKNEAEEANKAKSEFLASMSHELRTPLNAVLGFAQLLQFDPQHPLSEKQNVHVESILEGGDHLLQLINEVLDLARIEASKIDFSFEVLNGYDVAEECVALSLPLGESQGVKIINTLGKENAPLLRTDRVRFKQALLNLLSNAVKYNKIDGKVIVDGLETDDGFMRFTVKDTGVGIAEKDHDSVFQMFHRLGADPMIAREGTGIGLTVTKLLVERLGGRLGFESENGVGSTFWIELPLASNSDAGIWVNVVRTGVEAVDNDHRVLLSIIDKVGSTDFDDQDLSQVFDELLDYTQYHFQREEAIMRACEFPEFNQHQAGHKALRLHVSGMMDEWLKSPSPKSREELHKFLQDWLFNHIVKDDAEIAAFTKGKDQKIAKALETLAHQIHPLKTVFSEENQL
ncbi:MAG: bacteriohemerythrin [Rhodospirillaceae bacterium]|nr:bacteriohemerythrin [Rhodospirillaceae bacterium]